MHWAACPGTAIAPQFQVDESLQPGWRVVARGDTWSVDTVTEFRGCAAVRLRGPSGVSAVTPRTLLTPFDRLRRIDASSGIAILRPRRWLHELRAMGAASHPFGGLRFAAASRIDILPYQLDPALAVARGAVRVMIADAVGLGKTVQAGLILNELAGRGVRSGSFRALVAAPAGLREQWGRELAEHFSIAATVAGAGWLSQMGRDLPAGVNPWVLPGIYISSFDFLKRPEVLRPLEEVTWDALVVDEAHNVSIGTARRAAIHDIALRARRVVLLTATPHAGDALQYDALCRIGESDAAAPLITFRRTRQGAGSAPRRRSVLLAVRLSSRERRMHRLLDAYTARVCGEARLRGDPRARLAAVVLRKRALSSAASLAASASKRLDLLAGITGPAERQLLLPLCDEDGLDDDEPDGILAVPGLTDAAEERRLLREIADTARAAAGDESKTRVLIRLLSRAGEPAIVFTEYRDTLARLQQVLAAAGLRAAAMHGGQAPAERAAIQQAFNERGVVLLATDAAAEGLNLQARCRTVVHYELPWNPSRIEQRTGRVDRIGQRRRVHEILLVARDTAERLVLAPLARRAARARAAVSSTSRVLDLLTESRVAAAVMEGAAIDDVLEPRAPEPALAAPTAAAECEAARLRTIREWLTASSGPRNAPRVRAGPLITVARRGGGLAGATCLYRVALTASSGQVTHGELIALRDAFAVPPAASTCGAAREALDRWRRTREPLVRQVAADVSASRIDEVTALHEAAIASLERREAAMARARPSAARELVQPGLFDRRAVRAQQAGRQSAGALLEESDAQLASLERSRALTTSVELVALMWHFQQ